MKPAGEEEEEEARGGVPSPWPCSEEGEGTEEEDRRRAAGRFR